MNQELQRFQKKFEPCPASGCWLWVASSMGDGYGAFRNLLGKSEGAHRVAWRLFRGPIPDGMQVLHLCDVPLCVNPAHLFLGTTQQNTMDKMRKGRYRCLHAEEHQNAKLTNAQVLAIRADGRSQRKIAEAYGIGQTTVSSIKTGKTWHI